MKDPKFPHIEVELSGSDGNAFMIMGKVTKAMRRGGCTKEEIAEYREAAQSGSYDDLLRVSGETVTVS